MASGSKSNTSTSSSQATNVSELNLQDTGGITVADNAGPVKLSYAPVTTTTDYGAIGAAGSAIGSAVSSAFAANTNVTNSAINLASGLGGQTLAAATTLGQTAIDSGSTVANHGLDNAAAAYQSGLTFGSDALATVGNLLQDSAQREAALTSTALSGYQSIATQNSASNATQIQQVALYVIVAAVAIIVLPMVFKK